MQHLRQGGGDLVLSSGSAAGQADLSQHINGGSFPVRQGAFSGQCRVFVQGLPGAPAALFAGKHRRTHVILQVLRGRACAAGHGVLRAAAAPCSCTQARKAG